MATISTKDYLLDQAKRRFTPTPDTIPGMGFVEKRLLATRVEAVRAGRAARGQWPQAGDG